MDIPKNSALLIVDMQNDFCPGGQLAIDKGDVIVPIINTLQSKFSTIIATQDWHPASHKSFASKHPGKDVYDMIKLGMVDQVLWPDHCVQGTQGAEFHRDLNTDRVRLIIRKGMNEAIDSYSAFMENDKKHITGLDAYLKSLNVQHLFLTGLATNYCVMYSALDAIDLGFETLLIEDACKGVSINEGDVEKSLDLMQSKGIHIITSGDILL